MVKSPDRELGGTKYEIYSTKQFDKSYKKMLKRGKKPADLARVLKKIANGEKLPPKNREHRLTGDFGGCMECHIEPDWLLVYKIEDEKLILVLVNTGTHSDLF